MKQHVSQFFCRILTYVLNLNANVSHFLVVCSPSSSENCRIKRHNENDMDADAGYVGLLRVLVMQLWIQVSDVAED